jgi:poly(3-hydroxybutyrate) depolymerase
VEDRVFGDTDRRGPVDGNVLPAGLRAAVDHPLKDDVAFVRAILDSLPANYSVDTRRINT